MFKNQENNVILVMNNAELIMSRPPACIFEANEIARMKWETMN